MSLHSPMHAAGRQALADLQQLPPSRHHWPAASHSVASSIKVVMKRLTSHQKINQECEIFRNGLFCLGLSVGGKRHSGSTIFS